MENRARLWTEAPLMMMMMISVVPNNLYFAPIIIRVIKSREDEITFIICIFGRDLLKLTLMKCVIDHKQSSTTVLRNINEYPKKMLILISI
jgi:hypothetical protein